MPKKKAFRRARTWEIKTRPDLLHPRLEALHPISSELIRDAYFGIDQAYEKAEKILDKHGIVGSLRLYYRSFVEEVWKANTMYRGETLVIQVEAIAVKYAMYGLEPNIIRELARIFVL